MNNTIYCEVGFLRKFVSVFLNAQDNMEQFHSWYELYKYIYYSHIFIDKSPNVLIDELRKDKRLLKFCKFGSITSMANYPDFNSSDKPKFDRQMKNSVFFSLVSKEQRMKYSSLYGVLILGIDDVFNFSTLFRDKHFPISKDQKISWAHLIPSLFKVSNSLIVADNYLLKDEKVIKENLINILDQILPEQLPYRYSIVIFTFELNNQGEKRYNFLKQEISKIRSKLDFGLTIYKINKDDVHDRNIVTNNTYMECGGGFDLIKNGKSSKTTNLRTAYPFLIPEISKNTYRDSYLNFISTILGIEKRSHRLNFDFWGEENHSNEENRLADYYRQYIDKFRNSNR